MEGKAAVLGGADFALPFAALGLDTFAVSTDNEIIDSANKIVESRYALVVVAENAAQKANEVFEDLKNLSMPCVIVVPFTTVSRGFATSELGEALKRATGINILQNN